MSASSFVILIKQLNGDLIELECDPMDPILTLKEKINASIPHFPVPAQILVQPVGSDEHADDEDAVSHIELLDHERCNTYGLEEGSLLLLFVEHLPSWLDLNRLSLAGGVPLLTSARITGEFRSVDSALRYAVASTPIPTRNAAGHPVVSHWAVVVHALGGCKIGVVGNNETHWPGNTGHEGPYDSYSESDLQWQLWTSNSEHPSYFGWELSQSRYHDEVKSYSANVRPSDVIVFRLDPVQNRIHLLNARSMKSAWQGLPASHQPMYVTVNLFSFGGSHARVEFRHVTSEEQAAVDQAAE